MRMEKCVCGVEQTVYTKSWKCVNCRREYELGEIIVDSKIKIEYSECSGVGLHFMRKRGWI